MKLSVVIPCFNAADTLAGQLEAMANQRSSESWELIIADNGSTDESLAIVERYKERLPNLRLVDASARRGQPYALNVGAQAAHGEALLFCDADDEVGLGWLAAMGEALREHDFVACRTDCERLNPPWIQKSRRNPQRDGIQKYVYPPYLPHAGGATIGVKRSLYEAAGGFDESLPCLHDTDFCWKVQLAGTKLQFVPNAVLHLRFRGTLRSMWRQARAYAEYNVLAYKRYRQFGMPNLTWKAMVRQWVYLLRCVPQIRHKAGRAAWVWSLAWRVGRLEGSLKHRVFAP